MPVKKQILQSILNTVKLPLSKFKSQNTFASEAPPARPRQAAADPIEPVGTRTATPQDTLAAAAARGDSKAFRALREQGVNR